MIRKYIVDLVDSTRRHSDVYLGGSPRASIMMLRATRALAAAEERDFAIPDDVKTLAPVVLAHRIIVTADAIMSGRYAEVLVREIVDEVAVPVAENPDARGLSREGLRRLRDGPGDVARLPVPRLTQPPGGRGRLVAAPPAAPRSRRSATHARCRSAGDFERRGSPRVTG